MRAIDANKLLDDITAAEEHGGMGAVVAGTLRRYVMRQPTLTLPNELLTLDGLDGWNGRPAWLVPLGEQPWDAQWSIMEYGRFVVETNMGPTKSDCLSMGESGKTWFAYRRPVAGNGLNIDGTKRLHNSGESEESFHEFK